MRFRKPESILLNKLDSSIDLNREPKFGSVFNHIFNYKCFIYPICIIFFTYFNNQSIITL